MTVMARALLALAVLVALLIPRPAVAGPPSDQLRRSVDLVLQTLEDPQLKKPERTAERRAALRSIANEIFDFAEISQRALGRHWQARSAAERDEFVPLFADLLDHSYINKIEGYSGERIMYVGEVTDGDLVLVRTRIATKQGAEVPVDYKMLKKGERWRAYDVNIEGVSLVANYRTQFNSVISRESYQALVARLKEKRGDRPEARETGRPAPVVPASMRHQVRHQGP